MTICNTILVLLIKEHEVCDIWEPLCPEISYTIQGGLHIR